MRYSNTPMRTHVSKAPTMRAILRKRTTRLPNPAPLTLQQPTHPCINTLNPNVRITTRGGFCSRCDLGSGAFSMGFKLCGRRRAEDLNFDGAVLYLVIRRLGRVCKSTSGQHLMYRLSVLWERDRPFRVGLYPRYTSCQSFYPLASKFSST